MQRLGFFWNLYNHEAFSKILPFQMLLKIVSVPERSFASGTNEVAVRHSLSSPYLKWLLIFISKY